jgi:hypothetical protein
MSQTVIGAHTCKQPHAINENVHECSSLLLGCGPHHAYSDSPAGSTMQQHASGDHMHARKQAAMQVELRNAMKNIMRRETIANMLLLSNNLLGCAPTWRVVPVHDQLHVRALPSAF